jgi:hypothetical protein
MPQHQVLCAGGLDAASPGSKDHIIVGGNGPSDPREKRCLIKYHTPADFQSDKYCIAGKDEAVDHASCPFIAHYSKKVGNIYIIDRVIRAPDEIVALPHDQVACTGRYYTTDFEDSLVDGGTYAGVQGQCFIAWHSKAQRQMKRFCYDTGSPDAPATCSFVAHYSKKEGDRYYIDRVIGRN